METNQNFLGDETLEKKNETESAPPVVNQPLSAEPVLAAPSPLPEKPGFSWKYLLKCALVSLGIYIGLVIIATIVLTLMYFSTGDYFGMDMALLTVYAFGVVGGICLFGGCETFWFPFAPLVAGYIIIFIVVFFVGKIRYVAEHKRTMRIISLAIFLAVVLAGGLVYGYGQYKSRLRYQEAEKDRAAFRGAYGTEEKIETSQQFVRLKQQQERDPQTFDFLTNIIVSGLNGENERQIGPAMSRAMFVSPGGHYYVQTDEKTSAIRDFSGKEVYKFSENIVYPENFRWSPDEKSIIWHDRSDSPGPVLFDIVKKKKYILGPGKFEAGAAWSDDSSSIFLLGADGFSVIDNVKEILAGEGNVKPNIKILLNLFPCEDFIFSDGRLMCPAKATEANIPLPNDTNPELEGKDTYIISQTLDQAGRNDFKVISKAPFYDFLKLYAIDKKLVLVDPSMGGNVFLDIETGLQHELTLEEEQANIFGSPNLDPYCVPVKYDPNIQFSPELSNIDPAAEQSNVVDFSGGPALASESALSGLPANSQQSSAIVPATPGWFEDRFIRMNLMDYFTASGSGKTDSCPDLTPVDYPDKKGQAGTVYLCNLNVDQSTSQSDPYNFYFSSGRVEDGTATLEGKIFKKFKSGDGRYLAYERQFNGRKIIAIYDIYGRSLTADLADQKKFEGLAASIYVK